MRRYIALAIVAVITGVAGLILAPSLSAVAQDASTLAALDAKIANLENKNATLKKRIRLEALNKENAALRKQLGIADNSHPDDRPSIKREQHVAVSRPVTARPEMPDVLAYAAKESPYPKGAPLALIEPPPPPLWRGYYAGGSFGVGWLRAQEFSDSTNNTLSTFSSSFSSPTGSSSSQSSSLTLSETPANMTGADLGGIVNLHLGVAAPLTDYFVGGLQIEGGVSNVRVRLTGTGSTTSVSNSAGTSTSIPPSSSSTSSGGGTQSVSDTLANRWQISALARGGLLIDPYEMVYLTGGWTYAGFETLQNNAQLGLNGAIIGAGYERQISPLWGIKVEYRYTKFQSKTIDLPSISTTSSTTPQTAISSAFTSGSTSYLNTSARYSPEMQTVSVGISRYFGP